MTLWKHTLIIIISMSVFPYVSNVYGQTEPPLITPKEQLCSFDGINYGPCLEPPIPSGSTIDNPSFDDAFDDASVGVVVAGFIAAAVAIGVAASKGAWGKTSSKGTQKDSFTKSALQGYKSEFTKKYSGRPPWMHPETNTYGYEAAKSTETSPPHVMRPEDFDLRRIEGVGITNPPTSNPPPRNVTYKRTANSVN